MTLENIKFTQLNVHTWVAQATAMHLDLTASNKNQQQKQLVRALLNKLVEHLSICKNLDESNYPYKLITSQKYVCFSHCDNHVAVIISLHNAGVDVEHNQIAFKTVQRFFHADEVAYLTKLNEEARASLSRWLWQFKECMIKIEQNTLAKGLGINHLSILKLLDEHLSDKGDCGRQQQQKLQELQQIFIDTKSDNGFNIWLDKQACLLAVYAD